MLGSLLLTLAVSSAGLLVPAALSLLGLRRHQHMAAAESRVRRLRLVAVAVFVTTVGVLCARALGAGVVVAVLNGLVLGGSVVACARGAAAWAVRGVVAWALLVTAVLGFLGWLADRLVGGSASGTPVALGAAGWLIAALAVKRGAPYARARVAARARRDGHDAAGLDARKRPALSLLAAPVGLTVALAVTFSSASAPGDGSAEADRRGGHTAGPSDRPADGSPNDAPKRARDAGAGLNPGAGGSGTTGSSHRSGSAAGSGSPARANASASPSGSGGGAPSAADGSGPGKASPTPGYAKDKPNRPSHAPSPGSGRGHLP